MAKKGITEEQKLMLSERRCLHAKIEIMNCISGFKSHEVLKDLLPSELMEVLADMLRHNAVQTTKKKLGIKD